MANETLKFVQLSPLDMGYGVSCSDNTIVSRQLCYRKSEYIKGSSPLYILTTASKRKEDTLAVVALSLLNRFYNINICYKYDS